MSEITTFLNAKIKTQVKTDCNLEFMLPHYVNKKDTDEFLCYVFYTNTTITKINENKEKTPRYKEQKMIVWNKKLADIIDQQIKQGATHFSGICELKSYHRETITDNDNKKHQFYENFEYWVQNGSAINTIKLEYDKQDNGGKFTNYSNGGTINNSNNNEVQNSTSQQDVPMDEVDDDIPF